MSDVAFWLIFITVFLLDLMSYLCFAGSKVRTTILSFLANVAGMTTVYFIFNRWIDGLLTGFPWMPIAVLALSQVPAFLLAKVILNDTTYNNPPLKKNLGFWLLLATWLAMLAGAVLIKTIAL